MDYKWVVLTVTTVGIFMATLDASIIIVGLPTVVNDLHTNIVVGIWIITIYRLAITVFLVTIGRVADLFGRVRLYTWGFAVFTVGSLLPGLSPTAEFLLAFRLIQGTGAALLFVNGVAIVTDAFAGTGQLGKGIGLNQVAINAGTITGYTLSGILIVTPIIGWRSIFLVNVPVGIFGTYWSRKRLREISAPAAKEQFDIPGAVTFSGAITSLLLGLTLGGLDSPITVLLLLTSLVLTVIFLSIERHTKSPVLDLSLFKNRVFTIGNLSNLFSGLAFASLAFVMTLYFQLVRGFSAYNAGLALIPLEATLLLVGPSSGSLSDKYGARGLSTLGLSIASIGFVLMSGLNIDTPYIQVAIWLSLVGFGIGLFRSPNASSVMGAVPPSRRGISSGTRVLVISTSIVGSIPFATAMMTIVIPYSRLISITSNETLTALSDRVLLLNGLKVALIAFAAVNLIAAGISALRGPKEIRQTAEVAEASVHDGWLKEQWLSEG